MTPITLHPEQFEIESQRYVLLAFNEFAKLEDRMEDARDILDFEDAQVENGDKPLISREEVRRRQN